MTIPWWTIQAIAVVWTFWTLAAAMVVSLEEGHGKATLAWLMLGWIVTALAIFG